jgi:hypothetical protein
MNRIYIYLILIVLLSQLICCTQTKTDSPFSVHVDAIEVYTYDSSNTQMECNPPRIQFQCQIKNLTNGNLEIKPSNIIDPCTYYELETGINLKFLSFEKPRRFITPLYLGINTNGVKRITIPPLDSIVLKFVILHPISEGSLKQFLSHYNGIFSQNIAIVFNDGFLTKTHNRLTFQLPRNIKLMGYLNDSLILESSVSELWGSESKEDLRHSSRPRLAKKSIKKRVYKLTHTSSALVFTTTSTELKNSTMEVVCFSKHTVGGIHKWLLCRG